MENRKEPRYFSRLRNLISLPWRTGWTPDRKAWSKVSRDLAKWAAIGVPIGLVAGLGAVTFYLLWLGATDFFLGTVTGISYPLPGGSVAQAVTWSSHFPTILLLPLVMGLGGLGAGLIAEKLAPEVAGHGTDQTIWAFHNNQGKVRKRVPILKILASALTLGTGGSGGREGPTSQIGGGFGSWWADVLNLSPKERRLALASGLGAGVGAIFRAPLGGAIYSAEIFYTGDFEPEVFVPAIISSVVSYSVFGSVFGFSSLFTTPAGLSWTVEQIPLYALLGLVCAGAGAGFTKLFQRTSRAFSKSGLRLSIRACVGALASGASVLLVYFALPWDDHFASLSALNVGYGFVQATILNQVGLKAFVPIALIVIAIALILRMVTTSLTVGSGGSAGLFGTSVVVGAFLGTIVGGFFNWLSPNLVPMVDVPAFVVIGMMAFFGGISKAPLAVLVMIVEMTGSYLLLLPAMLAIFLAYLLTGNTHIYSEQVPNRLQSPAHREEYREFLLQEVPVKTLINFDLAVLDPGMTVQDALSLAEKANQNVFPIKLGDSWSGLVSAGDLHGVPEELRSSMTLGECCKPFEALVAGDAPVSEAVKEIELTGADAVAVVDPGPPVRIQGIVTRRALTQLQESLKGRE